MVLIPLRHRQPVVRRRSVVAAGLGGLLWSCRRDSAVSVRRLRLATGPAGAVYRRIGGGIARALMTRLPETDVHALPTRASSENISMLRSGNADLGLSSLDAVVDAAGNPPDGVVALGRLYDSYLHLVVLHESPVRSVADLEGLRVSFGAADSGTHFTSRRFVEVLELGVDARWLDQAESAQALGAQRIDAAFSLTGIPTPAITELATEHRVRLVPLPAAAGHLADAYPGPYFPATIPATTYASVPANPTVAVPNVLLARADLPADLAALVTDVVFTRSGRIAARSPEARQINVRTGIATGPIPLHSGAVRWFRERKR